MSKITHEDIAKKLAEVTSGKQDKQSRKDSENSEEGSHGFDLVEEFAVWEIGSDCRATYKQDKIDYEATIVDIYHDSTCLIEFLGPDNIQVENKHKPCFY